MKIKGVRAFTLGINIVEHTFSVWIAISGQLDGSTAAHIRMTMQRWLDDKRTL
jgi:hypothetical protein